jgi:hypothetical protein
MTFPKSTTKEIDTMLRRMSCFAVPVLGVVLALGGATKVQADGRPCLPVIGHSAGSSTATGHPSTYVYTFDVEGDFRASPIGAGTYEGTITLDYSTYTTASPCASVTGKITFTDVLGNTIVTSVSGMECETTPYNPDIHLSELVLTITGGTGPYENANGTIDSDGMTTGTGPSYTDEAMLSGTICDVNHAVGAGE